MSKLGPMTFGKREEQIFLGREISKTQDYSETTAQAIDAEIRDIIMRNYGKAKQILADRLPVLHSLANALIQREVLDGTEVDMIVQGKTLADIDEERKKRADALKAEQAKQADDTKAESIAIDATPKPVQA